MKVTFEGAEAWRVIELVKADDERRAEEERAAAQMTAAEMEARILAALPAKSAADAYERAGLPRPWFRAGHVMQRLRAKGTAVWSRRGIERGSP